MNYQKVYEKIITSRVNLKRVKGETYYERHHIVPKSLGGLDTNENLVLLTAKEHFVCHHLLTKIHQESDSLQFAFWAMCNQTRGSERIRINSVTYQRSKERFAQINSKRHKGKKVSQEQIEMFRVQMLNNNPHKSGPLSHLFGTSWPEARKKLVSNTKKSFPENNGSFKGWYVTPYGKFASCRQVIEASGLSYDQIYSRCKNSLKIVNKKIVSLNSDLTDLQIGKTFQELGWDFVPKE